MHYDLIIIISIITFAHVLNHKHQTRIIINIKRHRIMIWVKSHIIFIVWPHPFLQDFDITTDVPKLMRYDNQVTPFIIRNLVFHQ